MSGSVELEKFYARDDRGGQVGFRVDHDLTVDLDRRLGGSEGGILLVRLNLDGEGFDEVHVEPPAGSAVSGRTAPAILREVCEKLAQLAGTLDALEGAVQ